MLAMDRHLKNELELELFRMGLTGKQVECAMEYINNKVQNFAEDYLADNFNDILIEAKEVTA